MGINATTVVYNSTIETDGLISNQSAGQTITELSYDGYNRPHIKGTGGVVGQPIYLDTYQNAYGIMDLVTTSSVSDDGSWDIQFKYELPSGHYDAFAAQGLSVNPRLLNVSYGSISLPIAFDVVSQLPPVITNIASNSGDTFTITDHSTTNDTTPTIKGTAEPGSLVEIFDNGIKIGETQTGSAAFSTTALPSWDWSFTPAQPLSADQTHVFTVASRNLSLSDISMETTPSNYSYTIGIGVTPDQPALLAPVITSVVDDAGANQGAVADGGQTNDVRPTLHGTSEPGTVVTISDNGHVIGTATTGADWQWNFTPNTDLTVGTNTLSVSAARPDGSGGSTAAWYTHVLDVTPSLDAVLANAGLSATAAPQATATATPTAQAPYLSEATQTAALPQHDLAY